MSRLLPQLDSDAMQFFDSSTPYELPKGKVHSRGPHRFTICGHDRNNKKVISGFVTSVQGVTRLPLPVSTCHGLSVQKASSTRTRR